MLEMCEINGELCEEILEDYHDNPLFVAADPSDIRTLLMASFFYNVTGNEMQEIDINLTDYQYLFGNYFEVTKPEDIAIPAVSLSGTIQYKFSSNSSDDSLTAVVDAPVIGYLSPYIFEAQAVYPSLASSPGSRGIIFDPITFREIAYKNPQMLEIMMKGRERIYGTLLKWLPVNALTPIGHRIAQFLLACLPEDPKDREVVSLTQDAIASHLNCSRATLAKGISFLHNKGIIQTGHGKILVHTSRLRAYLKNGKEEPPPPS